MSASPKHKPLAETKTSYKSRLDIITDWLKDNYVVRVNLLDRSKVSLTPTENCSWEYKFAVTEDDIYMHAYAEEISLTQKLLKMILSSHNLMETFNPVVDYFEGLHGKFRNESQIDKMAQALRLCDDSPNAKQRATYLLKKWLVATVACSLGKRQNDVALGLVGERAGIGKTTFFEYLVPTPLRNYFQVAQKDDRVFQMGDAFAHRFILNFDEFAAIGASNEQQFKQFMSCSSLDIKESGSRYTKVVPRIASVCFTSNKSHRMGGFIRVADGGMLRRLAVIEVDDIDDYRSTLDVDQLWAEAVMLLDGGFDYEWTQEDYNNFVEENRQYVTETNAMRLVSLYYRKPNSEEEGVFMAASDIVKQLKEKKRLTSAWQKVDNASVGMALSTLGYKKQSKRIEGKKNPAYYYCVVPLFEK